MTASIAVPEITPSCPVTDTACASRQSETAAPIPPWMMSGGLGVMVASGILVLGKTYRWRERSRLRPRNDRRGFVVRDEFSHGSAQTTHATVSVSPHRYTLARAAWRLDRVWHTVRGTNIYPQRSAIGWCGVTIRRR